MRKNRFKTRLIFSRHDMALEERTFEHDGPIRYIGLSAVGPEDGSCCAGEGPWGDGPH